MNVKTLIPLAAVAALSFVPDSAQAQFGKLLNTIQKTAGEAAKAVQTTLNPDEEKPAQQPQRQSAPQRYGEEDAASPSGLAGNAAAQNDDAEEAEEFGSASGSFSIDRAEAKKKKENAAMVEAALRDLFDKAPEGLIEGAMVMKGGKPSIEYDEDTGKVVANVALRVNQEKYASWTKKLMEQFDGVCVDKDEFRLSFHESPGGGGDMLYSDKFKIRAFPWKKIRGTTISESASGNPDTVVPPYIGIATPSSDELRQNTWPVTIYYFEKTMWAVIAEQIHKEMPIEAKLKVLLKDGDGDTICSGTSDIVWMGGLSKDRKRGQFGSNSDLVPIRANMSVLTSDKTSQRHLYYGENNALVMPTLVFWTPVAGGNNGEETWKRGKGVVAKVKVNLGKVDEDVFETLSSFEIKFEYKYFDDLK